MEKEKANESFEEQAEAFRLFQFCTSKYKEIKEKISQARKEGKDPYIADLMLSNFKAKLHYAEISGKKEDMEVLKRMLEDAEKELKEAEEEKLINVKSEVEEGAKKMIKEELEASKS